MADKQTDWLVPINLQDPLQKRMGLIWWIVIPGPMGGSRFIDIDYQRGKR